MAFSHGLNIKEAEEAIVFGDLVAGYLAGNNPGENGTHYSA
jgi:hypothetical protein